MFSILLFGIIHSPFWYINEWPIFQSIQKLFIQILHCNKGYNKMLASTTYKNIFLFTKIKIKDVASLFSGLPLVLTKNESYQNFKQISLNKYYMYIFFIVVEIHEKERWRGHTSVVKSLMIGLCETSFSCYVHFL